MDTVHTFLMIGGPGSGKGTQGKLLAQKLGAQLYATGALCREYAAQPTYFGKRTKEVIESGGLMPEWFSMYLFEDELVKLEPEQVVVFDGSGRKVLEAKKFDEVLRWLERPYKVLYIQVSEPVLRERLSARGAAEGRADDVAAAVGERFAQFAEHTLPSVEFFRSVGTLVEVNGEQPIEAVHADILKALNL